MATGWWSIRTPYNAAVAIDEFGPGTLDGNPNDGPSYDACICAAMENGAAGYEDRLPTYDNIGRIRRDMIENGQWTQPAHLSNPRTGGAVPSNAVWEIPRLFYGRGHYSVAAFLDEQPATLTAQQLRDAIHFEAYIVLMVFQAHNLSGNEQNVFRHYVGIAAYGGDKDTGNPNVDEHGYGMVYVLNSDIAGQHGVASGQWMWIDALLTADPRAYVVMAKRLGVCWQ